MGKSVSSAPAVFFLFGEHAVVYDKPALVCSIEKRTTVKAEKSSKGYIKTDVEDLSYIKKSINKVREEIGTKENFSIEVESQIPVGAGLGSSAAVTTATIDCVSREVGEKLDKRKIAELSYEVEKEIQENASRSQTYISTLGGAAKIKKDRVEKIDLPSSPEIVIGYDGKSSSTSKMVAKVARLRKDINSVEGLINSLEEICLEGIKAIKSDNREKVGKLMNINHGLLEAIGVSSPSLDSMIWEARTSGALGAKITGAGGNGCIIALSGDRQKIVKNLNKKAEEVFTAKIDEGLIRKE